MRIWGSLRVKFLLYFVGFMTASLLLLAKSLFEQEHDALLGELQALLPVFLLVVHCICSSLPLTADHTASNPGMQRNSPYTGHASLSQQ